MQLNLDNTAIVRGHLARDPQFSNAHADGSKTVFLTVMVNAGKGRPAEAIACQKYLSADEVSRAENGGWPYGVLAKGDAVVVGGRLENGAYQTADGSMDYSNKLVFIITGIEAGESKGRRERRHAAPAAEETAEVVTA